MAGHCNIINQCKQFCLHFKDKSLLIHFHFPESRKIPFSNDQSRLSLFLSSVSEIMDLDAILCEVCLVVTIYTNRFPSSTHAFPQPY